MSVNKNYIEYLKSVKHQMLLCKKTSTKCKLSFLMLYPTGNNIHNKNTRYIMEI